jgi:hypothetical protein
MQCPNRHKGGTSHTNSHYVVAKLGERLSAHFDLVIGAMKRISTPYTFAIKIFPFFFCGICAFILALLLMNGALQKAPVFLVAPWVMAVIGYLWWKTSLQDLDDEVDDCGDYLLVKKRGEEDTILLSNISNVDFSTDRHGSQARITLRLATPGKFGAEISFKPPPQIYLSRPARNAIAEDLRVRAHKARSAPAV